MYKIGNAGTWNDSRWQIHDGGFMMAVGRVVETENLISKIKEKRKGTYEEKIMQVCVEEFDLKQEEILTSLKKAVDDRMLKIVNKNNKNSCRIVKEIHLEEDCVTYSHNGKTLESTDIVKDLAIRLDKTSHYNLTNLANEFKLFKAEMQQQITSLREHFSGSQGGTHLPKSAPNLDSSLLSRGSEHTIQNGMVNKNHALTKIRILLLIYLKTEFLSLNGS